MKQSEQVLLKAAENELQHLLQQKAEVDEKSIDLQRKITAVQRMIDTLRFVYDPPEESEIEAIVASNPGITEQVREVLRNGYPVLYPATAIRDSIERFRKISLKDVYKNPMAVIHQILRRLESQGEVESAEGLTGERAYKLKYAPVRQVMMPPPGFPNAAYMPASSDPMTTPPVNTATPDWVKALKTKRPMHQQMAEQMLKGEKKK